MTVKRRQRPACPHPRRSELTAEDIAEAQACAPIRRIPAPRGRRVRTFGPRAARGVRSTEAKQVRELAIAQEQASEAQPSAIDTTAIDTTAIDTTAIDTTAIDTTAMEGTPDD